MTADEVKARLYARHTAGVEPMLGPWTVVLEWRAIDLLAISAWSSVGKYGRVGYEVKVSRGDLRRELLNPSKRRLNVEWCNEFYFAVPKGLLTAEELAFEEPGWEPEDFVRARCPGFMGARCERLDYRRGKYEALVPAPHVLSDWYSGHAGWRSPGQGWEYIVCPTCDGRGFVERSRVEREAPIIWVPGDVGLIVCDGRGTRVERKAPRRREVPPLSPSELGQLVRWVSFRPDPRHHPEQTMAEVIA